MISVLGGSGFVGSAFQRRYPDNFFYSRSNYRPYGNVLYLISTTDNYNVYDKPQLDIETNLSVLMEVLVNWRRVRKAGEVFNFVSSWFVYGPQANPYNVRETAICDPRGFYSITKRAAEQLLISYCDTFDLQYRILRLGNVIGRGDSKAGPKRNAVQHMVNQLTLNEPVRIYGNGRQYRSFIHVDDTATAIGLIINRGDKNAVYNIGTDCDTWNLGDIITYAAGLLRSDSEITYVPAPAFHQQVQVDSFTMDASKLRRLGFHPTYTCGELFRELIPNPVVPGTVMP